MKKAIIVAFMFQLEAFGQGFYSLGLPYSTIRSRPTTCAIGDEYVYDTGVIDRCTAVDTWTEMPTTSGGLPAGLITISLTACPTGFSQVTGLDGVTLVGTLAAHGDVGTTGGSDTLTPVGTVSQPTFTGNSVNSSSVSAGTPVGTNSTSVVTPLGTNGTATATAQAFTGTPASCVVNHVHLEQMNTSLTGATGNGFPALLDASTSGGPTALWVPTGNPTVGGAATCTPAGTNGTSSVGAETFTGSSSTVAAQTFTGSALGAHLHATTATGTVSQPTFSGNSADNRSAFVKVIFCSKD